MLLFKYIPYNLYMKTTIKLQYIINNSQGMLDKQYP